MVALLGPLSLSEASLTMPLSCGQKRSLMVSLLGPLPITEAPLAIPLTFRREGWSLLMLQPFPKYAVVAGRAMAESRSAD